MNGKSDGGNSERVATFCYQANPYRVTCWFGTFSQGFKANPGLELANTFGVTELANTFAVTELANTFAVTEFENIFAVTELANIFGLTD